MSNIILFYFEKIEYFTHSTLKRDEQNFTRLFFCHFPVRRWWESVISRDWESGVFQPALMETAVPHGHIPQVVRTAAPTIPQHRYIPWCDVCAFPRLPTFSPCGHFPAALPLTPITEHPFFQQIVDNLTTFAVSVAEEAGAATGRTTSQMAGVYGVTFCCAVPGSRPPPTPPTTSGPLAWCSARW